VSAGIMRTDRVPHPGASARRIGMSYLMPMRCEVWLRIVESGSVLGPQVTLLSSLVLSPIQVQVLHRPSAESTGSRREELAIVMPLVPAEERVARPSRTFRGPVHGSWISLQLFDNERSPLNEERDVGASVDGIREVVLPLVARVHPAAWLSVRGSRERPEQGLGLDGELVFVTGIGLRLRMHPIAAAADAVGITVDVPLASVGTTLRLADRFVERDLPGLPAIMLAFLDAEGRPIGRERLAYLRTE